MQQSAENTEVEDCPESDEEDAAPLLNQQLLLGKGLCSARYSLAVILHFSLFIVYSLRVNLSITIIAMTNSTNPGSLPNVSTDVCPNRSHAQPNGSHQEFAPGAPRYDWSSKTQGVILSAFFYGYVFTQLLGGYWSGMFGGKLVLGSGLLSTSALTLLTPLAAGLGAAYLAGLQALLGMAEDALLGLSSPFLRPQSSASTWGGLTSSTSSVALAVFGVCSGSLSSTKILHVTLVLVPVRRSTLCHHWPISSHGRSLPLLAMMRSLPLWAIAVAYFCNDWLFYMLLTSMPTYLNNVLHFDIRENGLLSALPYIGNWLGTMVSGLLADFLLSKHGFSTATVRKLFSGLGKDFCLQVLSTNRHAVSKVTLLPLGMLLPAVSLVAVSYVGCNYTAAVVFLTLSMTVISMCGAGFNINHVDIAPRYAGFLLGITNTFGTISGIIAPTAVGFLTSQDLLTGWRNVFFVAAALNLFGLLFYVTFGSGTIQDWARDDAALQ
ncbi:sialin-like isoform X3 [Emydura macquarii macquarii]|uniref:sialin-like isoform X3 n=1 Tax=Emydura macquarii macquarii TaxID=1129001 RepID=UPI00352AB2FC